MQRTPALIFPLGLPVLAAFLCAGLASAPGGADEDTAPKDLHATVTFSDWDPEAREGVFKDGRELYLIVATAQTKIRKDEAERAGNRVALEKLGTNIWMFAKKDLYGAGGGESSVGAFKPRLLLAMGYGIEPLPAGRRHVPGIIGILGWYPAVVEEWVVPGRLNHEGQRWDVGFTVNEPILVGTEGTPDMLKRNKSYHVDGTLDGSRELILRSGRLLGDADPEEKPTLEVPVLRATRIVIPHPAFKALYPFCWEESYGAE